MMGGGLKQGMMARYTTEQITLLIQTVLDATPDGVLILSSDGSLVDFNHKFSSMWHVPKKILLTGDITKLADFIALQLEHPADILENLDACLLFVSIEVLLFKDGRRFECHSHPVKMGNECIGRVLYFRDVSRRVELEADLHYQKNHDALTGLPNRQYLFERLRHAIIDAKNKNKQFALFVFDINRFKIINDGLTHTVGDELLRGIASRLLTVIGELGTVARVGGDEFVMIVDDIVAPEQVGNFAKNILNILKQPFLLSNHEVMISASVGISLYPKDGQTVDVLLKNADTAMYRAKQRGMSQLEFYSSDMSNQSRENFEREVQLRNALQEKQFVLHYQPQFDLLTKEIIGAEALIRWQHPVHGLLLPDEFIRLAEEAGLIVSIGEWVLKTACLQMKEWLAAGIELDHIAVNVASGQFLQDNFVNIVKNILEDVGLQPEKLEIEIVENVIINEQNIVPIVQQLKKLGVKIALDDFGTGYSSIGYLKRLSLDRLKIDRSFVQHIHDNPDDIELVRAIIAMGKSFNLNVLAEGVETVTQAECLLQEKCHSAQGHYFSEPLTVGEFEQFVKTKPI